MGLFVKDKKILLELDSDARQSNTQIAKKVGLSKQVVNYRINKLLSEGTIKAFRTIINSAYLGYDLHDVLIKRTFRTEREKEFIDYVCKLDTVAWFVECSGKYDYILTFFAKDLVDLNRQLSDLVAHFDNYIADYELLSLLDACKLEYKYLYEDYRSIPKPIYAGNLETKSAKPEIDDTDLRILQLLDDNPRMEVTELAKKSDTTANIVAYRIKKLRDLGVIQGFRTVLDTQKVGKEWHIIMFKLNPKPKKVEQLMAYFRQHPNCVYLCQGLGNWQLMVDFHVNNSQEIDKIVAEIRGNYGELIKDHVPLRVPEMHKSVFFPKSMLTAQKPISESNKAIKLARLAETYD